VHQAVSNRSVIKIWTQERPRLGTPQRKLTASSKTGYRARMMGNQMEEQKNIFVAIWCGKAPHKAHIRKRADAILTYNESDDSAKPATIRGRLLDLTPDDRFFLEEGFDCELLLETNARYTFRLLDDGGAFEAQLKTTWAGN
jgi:hypothetical protein